MDPKKNLKDALDGQIESNYNEVVDSFDDMGLKPELLRGVYAYGLECPSALQQHAILPITRGRNVIFQSQSGCGTTTISISILQKIDPSIQQCQALVLNPTREDTQKMQEVIMTIGRFMSIECHACIGGNKAFPDSPQVVVGTPGRIQGLVQKGFFQNNTLKTIFLNEADETLSRGFEEQIYDIFRLLPPAQIILFSATMPQDVQQITTMLMDDPVRILVTENETLKGIKQFFITVGEEESKLNALSALLKTLTETTRTIVFRNTRRRVEELTEKLSVHDLAISAMHGDMDAVQRAGIIEDFRSGSCHVLIATNLLARGLDVQRASVVINYDLPAKLEDYIHRLCRKGITINFISGDEDPKMHEFEQFYNMEIEEMPTNIGDLI